MLITIDYSNVHININEYTGRLAVELPSHGPSILELEIEVKIEYFGVEGINTRERIIQSTEYGTFPVFFIEPQVMAGSNQCLKHRYLITYEGGDIYIKYPLHKSLILSEYNDDNGRHWALQIEGTNTCIVMPSDFMAYANVHES